MQMRSVSAMVAILGVSACAGSVPEEVSSQPGGQARARPVEGREGDCSITIGSRPWAEVSIDGRGTGRLTPLVGYRLACGEHRITLHNPELGLQKTENVLLRPGEPYKKIIALHDPG